MAEERRFPKPAEPLEELGREDFCGESFYILGCEVDVQRGVNLENFKRMISLKV